MEMAGICGLYERKIRDINPMIPNITYDITDLYNFIDGLADISALVWVQYNFEDHQSLLDHYGAKLIPHVPVQSLTFMFSACSYDHEIHAFLPYDRQWIKQKLFQHLKKLAQR